MVEGTTENPVVFKLKNQSTWINQSRIRLVNEEKKHLLQDGIMEESMIKEDGVIEGWLEVWMNENVENLQEYCPNGTWGAVCKQVLSLFLFFHEMTLLTMVKTYFVLKSSLNITRFN